MNSAVGGTVCSTMPPKNMSRRVYEKFSQLIYNECGITLPPEKKLMLQSRLQRRVRALSLSSFEEYYKYLTISEGCQAELVHTLDAVSTNKTEFFREPSHFDFLRKVAFPQVIYSSWKNSRKKFHIWSAGCSSGQEPYTLTMVLSDFLEGEKYSGFDYGIFGTDISQLMLSVAQRAIYSDQEIQSIPQYFRIKYCMKGKSQQKGNWRVVPELRNRIEFKRLNLMEAHFDLPSQMDIIFCRNVIIYFDRPTQTSLFEKFYKCLADGGYLFIGHSETLNGINDQFEYLQPTIYRKQL